MNLESFKLLVNAQLAAPSNPVGEDSRALLRRIRNCFSPDESDRARSEAGGFIDDLGLRFLCEQTQVFPYLGIAQAIHQALGRPGSSAETKSDWELAIQLASAYADRELHTAVEPAWTSNERVCCLSFAINELRKIGYRIELPPTGGIVVTDSEAERLKHDIEDKAASLGSALAMSASGAMQGTYSNVTGRFNLGRSGHSIRTNAKPTRPLAYLYQLGLRYFSMSSSASDPEEALTQLVDLVTWATALLDLSVGTIELMFARNMDLVSIMKRSVIYDSVFLLTQVKPSHAREYLAWMMSREPISDLSDKAGRTSAQIRTTAMLLLETCERACSQGCPHDFFEVSIPRIANGLNIDHEATEDLLRQVFTHNSGANQLLSFPPDDNEVNAAFRPLLLRHNDIILQPAPMAARAIVNAALQWSVENWKGNDFNAKVIGPLFEEFVREKLRQRGVAVLQGAYKVGKSAGECDAVISTKAAIFFLELKSKMLRRKSRSGDDVAIMADLAQALVHPQAQAMERHAALREAGSLTLRRGKSSKEIAIGEREVFKLSITRGDLGSLHDGPFLRLLLRAGCSAEFLTVDPLRQHELDSLNRCFGKLKLAAERAGEPISDASNFVSKSKSLSVYQLLLLLEYTTDNESFSTELQRTLRLITPLRDFYSEYEYVLQLGSSRLRQP